MTVNVNRLKHGVISGLGTKRIQYPCDNSTGAIKAGDLLWQDGSTYLAKPLDTDAHAASFIGVAAGPSVVSSGIDNATVPAEKVVQADSEGIFSMKSTAGDTFHPGEAVYIGADAQTVTNTVGTMTHPIGYVVLPIGVLAVVGGAGVDVTVYLRANK